MAHASACHEILGRGQSSLKRAHKPSCKQMGCEQSRAGGWRLTHSCSMSLCSGASAAQLGLGKAKQGKTVMHLDPCSDWEHVLVNL